MEIVLVAAVVLVVVVLALALRAKRTPGRAPAAGPVDDSAAAWRLMALSPGMFVRYRDERLVVERTLKFTCERERWTEHRLSDDRLGRSLWLEVLDRDPVVLTVFERLPLREDPPGVQQLERDGITYRLAEEGKVSYRSHERAGPGKRGALDYVEYASGRVRLAYECFDDGPWEVSLGHVIEADDVAAA